jgi:hypothetical protein
MNFLSRLLYFPAFPALLAAFAFLALHPFPPFSLYFFSRLSHQ